MGSKAGGGQKLTFPERAHLSRSATVNRIAATNHQITMADHHHQASRSLPRPPPPKTGGGKKEN
jgi:hypothetical protein